MLDERGLAHNFAAELKIYLQQSPRSFTTYTEKLNRRLAMIGFVSVIILDLTGHGVIGFLASLS